MKNTNKLLVVILAVTIALSGIAMATLTTAAATEINPYEAVKAGADATELSVGNTTPGNNAFGIEQNDGPNKDGVGNTYDGAWMKYASVAFGDTGAAKITVNYVSKATRMAEDAKAEIWVGGKNEAEGGKKVATVSLPVPEDRNADYTALTANADLTEKVTGTKDLYIVLTGTCDGTKDNEYVANVTNFVFTEAEKTENDDNQTEDTTGNGSDDGANDGSDNGSNNGSDDGANDGTTNKPTTGDVASVAGILMAGAAALGGLKLRKKEK